MNRTMDRLLVILDLDETLIHAAERPLARAPDFRVYGYAIYKRPHVDGFLAGLFSQYDVAIWTASGRLYAEAVLTQLLGGVDRFAFVWCADRCTARFDEWTGSRSTVKPLRKVRKRGYDLARVLVVDDSPEKHVLNYGNLIHVTPFEGDAADTELALLATYIDSLASEPNLRAIEKRGWRQRLAPG